MKKERIPKRVKPNIPTLSELPSIASGSRCRKLSPKNVPAAREISIKVNWWRFLPLNRDRNTNADKDIKDTNILASIGISMNVFQNVIDKCSKAVKRSGTKRALRIALQGSL
jgi:hypothetical protein